MDAVSCEFFRANCAHEEIFVGEYKRTNRTKRTKILRCFPHCCPEHVNRSYCGSPVRVQVRFPFQRSGREFGQSWTRSHSDVLVFAHFEEAQTDYLDVGSEVPYETVYSFIQTEQTPKGVWIEGALSHSDLEQNVHVYQINPGARWYYEWESAATKAQRFTKHVLRVYVFERAQALDRLVPRVLRVVALATSSEFLVVSYRRAPIEGRVERRDVLPLPSSEWGAFGVDDSSVASSAHHHSRPSPRDGRPVVGADVVRDAALDDIRADQKAWEALNEDAMLTSKHLTIMYYFLMNVDALPFHSCLRQWSTLLYDQLEGGQSSQKLESVWSFLQASDNDSDVDGTVQDPTARVVLACSSILGWLVFDKGTMDQLRQLLAECVNGLLDKRVLRNGYIKAVGFLRDRIDRFTRSSNQPPRSPSTASSSPLSLVTEEIMAVVFQNDLFKHLRSVFIGVLSAPTMYGFQAFVAQVRAMFVSTAVPRLAATRYRVPSNRRASPFDGTWDLDGDRSSVKSATRSTAGFSLGCAMHFLREWAQVSLQVTSEQSIAVASSWASPAGGGQKLALSAAMHLTLDGRRRVFRNFPSGLSSMIVMGSQMLGEYRGQVETAASFWVEFVSADGSGAGGFRWILQFQADDVDEAGGSGGTFMSVQGSVEQCSLTPLEKGAAASLPAGEQFHLNLAYNRSDA